VRAAFGIQHTKSMRHIVICGLTGYKYFATLFHKLHNFRKKKM